MKYIKIIIAALLSLSFFNFAFAATPKPPASPANTLSVTPAGAALGFTLTPIVTSVPIVANSWGTDGAASVIAAKNGDIVVIGGNDDVVRVYSNSDTKSGSKLKYTSTIPGIHGVQLASLNATIFTRMNAPSTPSIIQLNDNGSLAKTIASGVPPGLSITAAPAINSLIFGNYTVGGFYLMTAPNGGPAFNSLSPAPAYTQISTDPIGGTFDMYFDCCSLSAYLEYGSWVGRFSLDSHTPMNFTQNYALQISGGTYDGAAYGIGKIGGNTNLNGKFVINNRYDTLILNPETNERTTILSGGNYVGARVAPYPDGSLLITSGNTIFKLRCGAGCSFL